MDREVLTSNDLASGAKLRRQIETDARAAAGSLSETARLLAEMPELSWAEFRTTALLACKLRGLGWEVETFTRQPGLIARIGPRSSAFAPIALRMELDALPAAGAVAHTCGHNYHMAAVLESARILAGLSRRFGLQFVILGQPAEEVGTQYSGADWVIEREGLQFGERRVRGVLAFHGVSSLKHGRIAVIEGGGPAYAGTAEVIATISAPGGHAAWPHTTPRTSRIFRKFLTDMEDAIAYGLSPFDSVVFGFHSEHCGTRFNVIATDGEARGNLRWFDARTPDRVQALLEEVASQYNQVPGITVGVELAVGYQPTVVDGTLVDHLATAARHVAEVVSARRTTAAEDVGKYFSVAGVPIGFVSVGLGDQDYPENGGVPNPHEHHSANFAVTGAAEADLWKAVYMLVVAALLAVVGD
jgi:amidohydrolase